MPNDNKKMPMPMEQASYETSGPAPTSGKQDEIEIAESVLPEGARVERETARSEMGVGGGKADKWRGGGDYYYEVTPQGIKVTGGDKAKTLTGGKSTMLSWADTDPKTMKMIHAILASRTEKGSELGATYSAPAEVPAEPTRDVRDEFKDRFGPSLSEQMQIAAETYDDKRMDVARRAMKKYGYED